MSTTVDQRVVEMRFDNKQFESNVQTTMSTLEKFKRSLNLTGASKGLENVNAAAKNVNFSGVGAAADMITAKFSAMQVVGVTALANLTNSAINAGKRMVSALTIDPIKTGFQEYETQINAVQTILANTKSKGTTIDQVNEALDELNTYADKTIYNFTEMTRNIGTFTAAGVELDKSVTSIKGIANLAAVSGSTSQQASTAMYQLSQALAAGKVQLMDWNSVVNAGMGGEVFQNALKRTAKNLGTNVDAMIKKYGSFRESLTKGEWLTAEVLTETLTQLSGAYTKADLLNKGYTEEQANEILDLAKTAEDAATKVKTFTQLWDTLKESAQSGWTSTWELIVGDFEEAKEVLTQVNITLGDMIGKSAEARNELIKGWKDAGGRNDLIESFKNAFEGLMSVIKPVREAFEEVFPDVTSTHLVNFTKGLKDLTEKFTISEDVASKLKRTFKGVFSIFEIGRKILVNVGDAIVDLIGSEGVTSLGRFLLDTVATIGDFFTSLNEGFDTDGFSGILSKIVNGVSSVLDTAVGHFENFGDVLSWVGNVIRDTLSGIWEGVKTVFAKVSEHITVGDIFAGLAGGGIFVAAKKVAGFLDGVIDAIKSVFGGSGAVAALREQIGDILGALHDSLNAFATGVKISSLVSIAIAVGILAASLRTISEIDSDKVLQSLGAIGSLMVMLSLTMASVTKTISTYETGGIVKTGIAMIMIAKAVDILADAMIAISGLSFKDIVKGLIGIGGALLELSIALKIIDKTKISVSTGIAILALAAACKMLGDALTTASKLSWDEIKRGLVAMGGALLELTVALSILSKAGGWGALTGALGILVATQALSDIAEALKSFGTMSWEEIKRGLVGMGGALLEIGIVLGVLGKVAGFSSIFAAGAIFIVTQGLSDIADALKKFGEMTWEEIERGLVAMGGALCEIEIVVGVLAKVAGFSSLFAAGAILMVIQGLDDTAAALERFGAMTWEDIKKGLTGMGGALAEIGAVTAVLGKVAGFSSLFAGGAILMVIQGLSELSDALKSFGGMTWDEITNGLTGMGGSLVELEIVLGSLGPIAGFSSIFAAGAILIVVQGLADVADALRKFGQMTWEEIKRGLTAMGGALGEVAIVSGLLGKLGGFASIIGGGSILLAVQGLGDIADALKKFGEMSWDEIKRGLTAMGVALSEVALGGLMNTLSGLGAISITAIASSLGDLADGVNKWRNVTIPEGLGEQLGKLADGVEKFTFAGLGAGALTEACSSIGILADSVTKWKNVSAPKDFAETMDALSAGIKKFTWDGLGAGALAEAAPSIGILADSVKKWKDVTVPEGIETKLSEIANGVKAFSFAFAGGWSISAIVTPLGNLSDSIKKWKDVSIPETLTTQLTALANGVKAFSFAFAGGWSMEAIVGPLGEMATSVQKWSNVVVPEGLEAGLKSIAYGLIPFSAVPNIAALPTVISSMYTSFNNLSTINYPGIESGINGVSSALSNLGNTSAISATLNELGHSIVVGLITPINNASREFSNAGTNLVGKLSDGITTNMATAITAMKNILMLMRDDIVVKAVIFKAAAVALMLQFVAGISENSSKAKEHMTTMLSSAETAIKDYWSDFYDAGSFLVSGFVAGISANTFRAEAQAAAMARAALEAAEDELDVNSPSKKFYEVGDFAGMGFVNALGDYAKIAYSSASDMASSARAGLQDAVAKINDLLRAEIETQPTIRPVLDLSNVRSNASALGSLLSVGASAGTLANAGMVSAAMSRMGQNGTNDDVVSAINKLRSDLGNLGGDTYTIGGITYSDGSEVSDAIRTLVRAAKMERRS